MPHPRPHRYQQTTRIGRRVVNVSLQPAVKPEGVIEVEIEKADNSLREGIQAARSCDLEVPMDFGLQRRAKNEGLGLSHSVRLPIGSATWPD